MALRSHVQLGPEPAVTPTRSAGYNSESNNICEGGISMHAQHGISRRHMLAMSAAAGSLTIGSSFRGAWAQGIKRIERLDPALDAIVDVSEPIMDIATNLGG